MENLQLTKSNSFVSHNLKYELFETEKCNELVISSLVEKVRPLYLWYSPDSDESDIRNRISGHKNTILEILSDEDNVISFSVCLLQKLQDDSLLLFKHGTIISPLYHSRGLYKQMLRNCISSYSPNWMATRTQNPRVYEAWLKEFNGNLFPLLNNTNPDYIQDKGREVIKLMYDETDIDFNNFVVKSAYRHDRTGVEYHICLLPEVARFFDDNLGIYDAFLLLVKL